MLMAMALVIPLGSVASAQIAPMSGCLAWTADSTGLIYCSGSVAGSSELFERSDDGDIRQLTYLGGMVQSAVVSSNGTLITFHATLPTDPDPQIYVIARHGPRARKMLVGTAVIELGKRTVMVGGTPIEVRGAQPRRLTDIGSNVDPAFAPDSERIGFTSDRLGASALWSMNIDGSDQRELLVAQAD